MDVGQGCDVRAKILPFEERDVLGHEADEPVLEQEQPVEETWKRK